MYILTLVSLLFWLFLMILVLLYNFGYFSRKLGMKTKVNIWLSPFECGFISKKINVKSFSSGFFLILVFFVIFDLEVSLLLNIAFQLENIKTLMQYWLFIFFIVVGFLFEVETGFMGWSK